MLLPYVSAIGQLKLMQMKIRKTRWPSIARISAEATTIKRKIGRKRLLAHQSRASLIFGSTPASRS